MKEMRVDFAQPCLSQGKDCLCKRLSVMKG